MAGEQPDARDQLNALVPDEADRAALWKTAWDAYYEQYNAFRDTNPGWQAFFTAHHSAALDAALEALLPQIIARGIAEGLRQATEGRGDSYARGVDRGFAEAVAALRDDARYEQWWSALSQDHPDYGYWSQHPRRQFADYLETVGPWEPAEQPGRDPLADDPVARRLGLIDAEGRTLCRCLAGDPACPHRPAGQPEPAREEAKPLPPRRRYADPGLLIEETDEDGA